MIPPFPVSREPHFRYGKIVSSKAESLTFSPMAPWQVQEMRIKICGITNQRDAQLAIELGADAIGLNFYPKSKRFISLSQARAILKDFPSSASVVALFVNAHPEQVATYVSQISQIDCLQLHGDNLGPISSIHLPFIPAFPVRTVEDLQPITAYLNRCGEVDQLPMGILVDAHVQGEYGGTGEKVDWLIFANYRPAVPLFLAGGLTPNNVIEAIRLVRPTGVDVASGVESAPGKKDPEKLRRFIGEAQTAFAKYGSFHG